MGMFCLTMMRTALELARENPVYENIATKFFEHFLGIAAAMNNVGRAGDRTLGRNGRIFLRRSAYARGIAICRCGCVR